MKSRGVAKFVWFISFCFIFGAFSQEKPIRLRNELIRPNPVASLHRQAGLAAANKHSGLYLVQFTERFQPAWQAELQAQGVQLLRYIPEDSFIVRMENADAGNLRRLPFVHWIGKYRPEHKLHDAIARRVARKVAGDPVAVSILLSPAATAVEIAQARGLLQRTHQQSKLRFGTVLRGAIPTAQLEALANSEAVLWVEPEFRPKLVDEVASKIVAGDGGTNRTLMQSLGYDGAGVRVAVADSGLHTGEAATMHPDLAGRANTFFYYGSLADASDRHGHGTHVAGIVAGNGATGERDESGALYGLGVAPGANIIAQRIFDGDGNFEPPPTFETLTRDAVRAGADIGSNSWGDDTQGRYDISAAEFDELVRDADGLAPGDQSYILEFSAGNAGPATQTIGSPAVAKNVIATAASDNNRPDFFIYGDGIDVIADFSSRGPCEDGRIKPDVTAPGTWISSLRSVFGNDDFAWAVISDNYIYEGGTSQAGPHVSGAAAVFVQYYRYFYNGRTPSPALVKAALINSARDMDDSFGTDPVPNMDEGWGRVNLPDLIGSPRAYTFLDQTQTLTTGQSYEQHLVVASARELLKITLAYTDVPGFPGAIPALVNDLDLEVVAPDGQVFLGNQFSQGESYSGAPAGDRINNVEAVHISEPLPGEYIVRVRAYNVVQDARHDTPQVDQDFALVMSGDFPAPGTATLVLDRTAYTVPSEIRIKLFDTALAAQSTATVVARSTTESSGESILLRASSSGIFTGRVATVSGPAVADGRLQLANGDRIDVSFDDPITHQTRTAMAVGDFVPPVISGIFVTNRFGRTVIGWNTDEPSTSIVRFGTNSNLQFAQTNLFFDTSHQVALDNLRPRTTYYFLVSSADAAGNVSSNNNSGQLYSFTVAGAPTVLLVNAWEPDGITTDIPLSTYTDTLNAIGVSYDVWDIEGGAPSPRTNDLRPYRVVIWRVSDGIGSSSTLTAPQQSVIRQYLSDGGSFFFASMEHLSRLNSSFEHDVLHVQAFAVDVGVPEILGINGNPLTTGMDMPLDYSAYYTEYHQLFGLDPDLADTLTLTPDAAPLLLAANSRQIAGLTYPRIGQSSTGRVVFLSFPLDVAPASGTAPNTRAALLKNIIDFLAPGQNGIGRIALDSPKYTLPSLVTVEAADSDLAGTGQTIVQLYSDSVTNRVSLVLNETIPSGLFRGSITVMTNSAPLAPDQLRARAGDSIHAEYYDASSFATMSASAVIDTIPAVISNIAVVPDYVEATISWDTSEDTDALVQFGESPFMGRTAYSAHMDTTHEVVLRGLLPDHVYYFQVVSRDVAGNTTVDDNNGQLYTFRTLRPVVPPYFDNFETGVTNWQVFTSGESQSAWTLGVPNNGVETAAHSPLYAWGSSINGANLDTIDTFLISPPIDLTGGNSASLSFWTSYDFSANSEFDIYNVGQLMIVTNNAGSPITVRGYSDLSGGWYQEQVDLTPYVGNVVHLVWYHSLFSFDSALRPGWLIDDVSVTLTNLPSGIIVVSNNLAQANFVMNGPMNRVGRGYMVFTNVTPGQYVVTFGAVPYYQTPPGQTNTLNARSTVLFQGNYTFVDANTNGISDTWEQQYFGGVSPTRTRFTDSDGDGFTDYAEFVAGTNPTSTNSFLELAKPAILPDGSIRMTWASVSGRIYRVEGSANALTWTPVSDWVQASGSPTVVTLPRHLPGAPYLFRLQVRP